MRCGLFPGWALATPVDLGDQEGSPAEKATTCALVDLHTICIWPTVE